MGDFNSLNYNLDTLLEIASRIAWIVFILYTIIFLVWSIIKYGFKLTIIRIFSYRVLFPLLVAISISLLSAAVVFIQPPMVGVVVSLPSPGGVRAQPIRAGFHLIMPVLEEVAQYPIYWQTYTMSSSSNEGQKFGDDSIRARTKDGQEIRLDCSVIFRLGIIVFKNLSSLTQVLF